LHGLDLRLCGFNGSNKELIFVAKCHPLGKKKSQRCARIELLIFPSLLPGL
jgi:hypothetical protein